MRKLIFLIFVFSLPYILSAANISIYEAGYSQHRDTNVRVEWVTDVIHRRGVYIEHNIYVTFAYDFNSWFFKNYNELELEWEFSMPEQAVMFDLFYWYSPDSVIQANILDKWTAAQMFNEKTSPYREPALFTRTQPDRNGQVTYNLKLFPIKRDKAQRIMIKYLVPATSTSGKIRTWLPINQVTTEDGGADSLRVLYYYQDESDLPELIGKEGYTFKQYEEHGTFEAILPVRNGEFVEFILNSPIKSDFFITTFENEKDKFYQLAVYPPDVEQTHQKRKMLILVDYSTQNTDNLTSELLLTSMKETMERSLTPEDSVAIIIGFEQVLESGDSWLPCTPANLDLMFGKFFGHRFLQISTSQEVLYRGAEYLRENGNAEVLWITNRNDFPVVRDEARQYAYELINFYPPGIKFHVLDLENKQSLFSYLDYGYVAINFPFTRELTRETQGNLFFMRFHPLKTALAALFFEQAAHFEEIEVYTEMQRGYTFQQKSFSLFRGYYPLDFPIIQTGKFKGDFPMQVSIVARFNDEQIKKDLVIQPSDVATGSDKIATAQYGQYLQELAHQYQDNWLINEMIDFSIESRILTAYTAFMVPDIEKAEIESEFGDESNGGDEGWDNGGRTGIEETADQDTALVFFATPNPFNPATTFKIYVPAKYAGNEITINIYNILGQQVASLRQDTPVAGEYKVFFNAMSDAQIPISSGTYFAVLHIKDLTRKLKLLYIK